MLSQIPDRDFRLPNAASQEEAMVSITALWLPILLSAVIVFVVSSNIHMMLPIHKKDYRKLPEEDKVLDAMRAAAQVPSGQLRCEHFLR
jgi:hypothetical protein